MAMHQASNKTSTVRSLNDASEINFDVQMYCYLSLVGPRCHPRVHLYLNTSFLVIDMVPSCVPSRLCTGGLGGTTSYLYALDATRADAVCQPDTSHTGAGAALNQMHDLTPQCLLTRLATAQQTPTTALYESQVSQATETASCRLTGGPVCKRDA